MTGNVFTNYLSALVILVILGASQGHPSRQLVDQRSVKRNVPTPEANPTNRNEPQFTGPQDRESLDVEYEPRIKLSAHSRHNIGSDGKIVFPSDLPFNLPKNFTPPPGAVCKNATFCEHPLNYPAEFIRNAIKSRDDLKYLATTDDVPELGQRVDTDDGDSLCQYEDKVIYPKTAESKDNEWHYIVNEDNFPQGVRIEECRTVNTTCSIIEGSLTGYKTTCKQKYVYRQLAAVTSDGSLDKKSFRFAASCCCHLKFTGNVLSRMAGNAGGDKASLQSPAPRPIASRAGGTGKK